MPLLLILMPFIADYAAIIATLLSFSLRHYAIRHYCHYAIDIDDIIDIITPLFRHY
jgi:hypothetical protein